MEMVAPLIGSLMSLAAPQNLSENFSCAHRARNRGGRDEIAKPARGGAGLHSPWRD